LGLVNLQLLTCLSHRIRSTPFHVIMSVAGSAPLKPSVAISTH
jgi:hypothetical protein